MARTEPEQPGEEECPFPGLGSSPARQVVEELASLRRRHGLSQTVVAARMGTSQSAVARLESGVDDVRLSTLTRYASAVGGHLDVRLQVPEET
jgi:transcriptional regulator with XRE-family HTH domain